MDCLNSPQARIVLEIKEGNGFGFLSSNIFAIATFKESKLQTKEVSPSNHTLFDSELVWEIDTKYLRKLRSSNTALKIEFFTSINPSKDGSKKLRIGYVLLNLKEAVIVPKHTVALQESCSWHRLLDLKNVSQAHKPEVLISFRIQEFMDMNSMTSTVSKEEGSNDVHKTRLKNLEEEGTLDPELKPLTIGPPHLCTELYELSISFLAVENLAYIIPISKLGRPLKIHFVIFGISILTEDISSLEKKANAERVTFQLWSKIDFLSAYFQEFPTLVLSISSCDSILGITNLDLQFLGNLSNRKNAVINSILTIKPTEESESFQTDTSTLLPTLQISVSLHHKSDRVSTMIDQEIQTNTNRSPGKVDAVTNTGGIDYIEAGSSRYESSLTLGHQSFTQDNPMFVEEEEIQNASVRNVKEDKIVTSPRIINESLKNKREFILQSPPHTYRLSNSSIQQAAGFSKEYIRDAAIKACEELEDWKEKQQQMFEFELKKKTERRLKKLSSEWLKHKLELENELKKKIEECQDLKQRLNGALEELTQRCEMVAEKEEELKVAQEELDKRYTLKFNELRKASKLCEYDMEDKINSIKLENLELTRKLEESGKEIMRLQQELLQQDASIASKGEIQTLLSEVKSLEQKLQKALESKTFFKEQWGKAVRELHRMKEEEQQQLRLQIEKNRQELQTLGLVKEIGQEVGEMKKDQFVLKNIRNELSNYISSSDPAFEVNCFSGT